MGMYTELMLRCELEKMPEQAVNTLKYMSEYSNSASNFNDFPEHEFFKCSRWKSIGWSNSYYFTPLSVIKFSQSTIDDNSWFLIIACDLKNYDNEIEKFMDWIDPYLVNRGDKIPIGWKRYEEDEEPTILYT